MRFATAANVGFAAVNPLKDIGDKLAISKEIRLLSFDIPRYLKDWASAFIQVWKSRNDVVTPRMEKFMESGADYSTQQVQLHVDTSGLLGRLLSPVEKLNNIMEKTTKLSSFENLGKKGVTGNEQIIRTRRKGGSPDFAVKGELASAATKLIPFFNAQIQGIKRTYNSLADLGKEDPTRLASLFIGTTGAAFALDEWNSQFTDPDGTPSLDRITNSDKENYWPIIMPQVEKVHGVERHVVRKIPKGHVMQVISNPIEELVRWARRGEGTLPQSVLNLVSNITPGSLNIQEAHPILTTATGLGASLNPLLKGALEQGYNKSFYSNVPIVPRRLEGMEPGLQAKPETPESLKKIGEFLNFSPARLQALSETFLPGSTGEYATALGDVLLGETPPSATKVLTEPVTRRFRGSPGDQAKRNMEQTFYDALEKSGQKVVAYNNLRAKDPEKAASFLEANRGIMQQHSYLAGIASQLGHLRQLPDEEAAPRERMFLEMAMQFLKAPGPKKRKYTKTEVNRLYDAYKGEQ